MLIKKDQKFEMQLLVALSNFQQIKLSKSPPLLSGPKILNTTTTIFISFEASANPTLAVFIYNSHL